MKRTLTILMALTLLAAHLHAIPGKAQGQTFYVDPTGSDSSGDGSPTHPWASIRYAATLLDAGDTLLVNPGTYQGGITLETSGSAAEPVTLRANGTGVTIEGSGGERDALFIDQADYVVVDGITIQHATRAGLRISLADHVTVRNSTFANNGVWGVFTDFSDYTTIENSESYGAADEHGIYISNSSDYPTIRHNRLHHNHGCGLHMNGDISMGGDGIISQGLVEGNIIYENGLGGGSGINMDGVTDTLVRNNLLYANHAGGISLYQIDGGSGSQDNRVLNNTILMATDGRWAINIGTANSTGNKIFNNILYNEHSWRGSISTAETHLTGFESDYNIIMDRFSVDTGDTRLSLSDWQSLGYDIHSQVAAPAELFTNPAAEDFHLTESSPAVDHGASLNEVNDDLEGNARPQNLVYDIGAYELTPTLVLSGRGGDGSIFLSWGTNRPLPEGATWRIIYDGPSGSPASPITGIPATIISYQIGGLANNNWYLVTLNAMQAGTPVLTDTLQVMPSANSVYLPYAAAP